MSRILRGARDGVPVVRLEGEVGADEAMQVEEALAEALLASADRVLVDLRSTVHLNYRVAGMLAEVARSRRRLRLVGATPYVRQILRLAGAEEGEGGSYDDIRQALAERG